MFYVKQCNEIKQSFIQRNFGKIKAHACGTNCLKIIDVNLPLHFLIYLPFALYDKIQVSAVPDDTQSLDVSESVRIIFKYTIKSKIIFYEKT